MRWQNLTRKKTWTPHNKAFDLQPLETRTQSKQQSLWHRAGPGPWTRAEPWQRGAGRLRPRPRERSYLGRGLVQETTPRDLRAKQLMAAVRKLNGAMSIIFSQNTHSRKNKPFISCNCRFESKHCPGFLASRLVGHELPPSSASSSS